jgi:hypothetical protein
MEIATVTVGLAVRIEDNAVVTCVEVLAAGSEEQWQQEPVSLVAAEDTELDIHWDMGKART